MNIQGELKKLIPFILKLAASQQEFDRSCLNTSWVYETYQKSEPLIILKHKSYSPWERKCILNTNLH